MSKHTPGPWKYCYLPQHRVRVVTADVSICDIALWTCDYEEQMANGLLIAAAPDLLEALKQCCTDLMIAADNARDASKTDPRWEGVAEKLMARVDKGRAAIAKAEGKDDAPR